MKKSDELRLRTRKMIAKNLIILVALAVVAFVGVYSWFFVNEHATADGVYAQCTVPEGMEIAVVAPGTTPDANTVWHDTTFDIDSAHYPFIGSLSYTEITGDGISFVKPKIVQYGSVAMADTSKAAQWQTPIANDEYMSFDIYMRTQTSGESSVVMDANSYYGPDSYTQTFGDSLNGWSPHTVIGAARMSVVANPGTNSAARKLLWIPAPFLSFDPVTRTGDNELLPGLAQDQSDNTYGLTYYDASNHEHTPNPDGTYNHGYYLLNSGGTAAVHGKLTYSNSVDDAATHVTANTSLVATDKYHLPYDVPLATFVSSSTATYDNVTYYQQKVRVNMWIEGEDPESRSAQVSGQFKVVLDLKLDSES